MLPLPAAAVELFDEAFGVDSVTPDDITFENVTFAIAAFERTLISDDSRYDRYARGERDALSESERRGLNLFRSLKTRCFECHNLPTFNNPDFKVVGVPDVADLNEPDLGRSEIEGGEVYVRAFKVTGVMILAGDDVEVSANEIRGNNSVGIAVAGLDSYFGAGSDYDVDPSRSLPDLRQRPGGQRVRPGRAHRRSGLRRRRPALGPLRIGEPLASARGLAAALRPARRGLVAAASPGQPTAPETPGGALGVSCLLRGTHESTRV